MQRSSDTGSVLGASDRGCPRVLHRPIRVARALHNGRCAKSCSPRARQVKRALRSRDVGNRVVGEQQPGVHWPGVGTQWRTSLHRPRRPRTQVLEEESDDCRILDSSAMTRIGSLHLGQKVTLTNLFHRPADVGLPDRLIFLLLPIA
jgi:hypothetical protein